MISDSIANDSRSSFTRMKPETLWIAEDCRDLFARHGLRTLDDLLLTQGDHRLEKPRLPSWRQRVTFSLADGLNSNHTFFLKRYIRPPLREQFKRIGSGQAAHGTAWAEWRWSRQLAADGVAAAEAVGFGERMRGWREVCSVVVTRSVPGQSMEQQASRMTSRVEPQVVRRLAEFVGRFHRCGYVHRDLYLCHIFGEGEAAFRLIDLQRMIAPRWRRRRWFVKDLAALNFSTPLHCVSRIDRVRFLCYYLGMNGGRMDKTMGRAVAHKSRLMARREERHGRLFDWQRWLL